MITELGDIYYKAELALLRSVAKRIVVGLGTPNYVEQQRKQAKYFQADVVATLLSLRAKRHSMVAKTLGVAYKRGVVKTIKRIKGEEKPLQRRGLDKVQRRIDQRITYLENVAMANATKRYMAIITLAGEKGSNLSSLQWAMWKVKTLL